MFIYFIRAVDGGAIKIGRAKSVKARLAQLQAYSPVRLEIVGICKGSTIIENALHRKFALHRSHNEWFEPCDELLQLVARLSRDEQNPSNFVNSKPPVLELWVAGYSMTLIAKVLCTSRQWVHQQLSWYDYKAMERAKPSVTCPEFYHALMATRDLLELA